MTNRVTKLAVLASLTIVSIFSGGAANSQVVVQTVAGNGSTGSTNGTGIAAQFNYPNGLAKDGAGNLYTADWANHVVRKITPAGAVTVHAGTPGVAGTTNGLAAFAKFNLPRSIAADSAGNVYVFEQSPLTLRKISASGMVSTLVTLATWQSSGYIGGFSSLGMAADSSGNVYLAEWSCQCIRKVNSTGTISILAGGTAGFVNATGSAARFRNPQGVAVDVAGNVYVADTGNSAVRKITPTGVVTTVAGTGVAGHTDGPGPFAQFYATYGIVVAPNNGIYVADFSGTQSYVRYITPAGVVSTLAGQSAGFADGAASVAKFGTVTGLVTHGGKLFAADLDNQRIRAIRWERKPVEVVDTKNPN